MRYKTPYSRRNLPIEQLKYAANSHVGNFIYIVRPLIILLSIQSIQLAGGKFFLLLLLHRMANDKKKLDHFVRHPINYTG